MNKIIVSTFVLAMLGSSTSALADSNKLTAFEGINTSPASAVELNQVSGEGLLMNFLSVSGLLDTLPTISTSLKINGENAISISTDALLMQVLGTTDQLVDEVVYTVDGVVTTTVDLLNNLDIAIDVSAGVSL